MAMGESGRWKKRAHIEASANRARRRAAEKIHRRRMLFESLESRTVMATLTGGTGPGGFELTGASGTLALWLDGSDINADGSADSIADGAAINSWSDKSGYNRHANGVMGAPFYVASSAAGNSQPMVGFNASNGADQLYTSHDFNTLSANYSIFAVSRYTGGNNQRIVSSRSQNWLFGHWGGGDQRWYAEGWIHQDPGSSSNLNSFHTYAGIIGPGVSGSAADPGADFWIDGVQTRDNNTGSGGSYKPGLLSLGSYTTGAGEASNAEVGEVIIIDRAVSDAERQVILNALSAKYNLSIGGQDRYAGDDALVGGLAGNYDQQVFGIGLGSDAQPLLSAGQGGFGIETASLADAGDFVVAGHKLAVNSKTTAGTPVGVSERFARSWYVDVTDANDNLGATFSFDYSDAGLTRTNESQFTLLRSVDGGNTWSDVGVSATLTAGDRVSFNLSAAQLSDGLYTLGDASTFPLLNTTNSPVYAELGGDATAIDNGIVLGDLDSPNMSGATVVIATNLHANDELLFTDQNGISGTYNAGAGTLTLTGVASVADYQAALRSVTYRNAMASASVAPRNIVFSVTDTEAHTTSASRPLVPVATAEVDSIHWQGDIDSDWMKPGNWIQDRVPDANDRAVFEDAFSATTTVNVTSSTMVGELRFANAADTFLLTGSSVLTDRITHTGGGTTRITAAIQETGLLGTDFVGNITAGSLALVNTLNILNGTISVTSGGELIAAGGSTAASLGNSQVELNNGKLKLEGLAGNLPDLGGVTANLQLWLDASFGIATDASGVLTWQDRSSNDRDATRAGGNPALAAGALNGKPVVQFRRAGVDDYFNVNGNFHAKEMYFVWRSPTPAFNNYGGILGTTGGRNSTFIVENNNTNFHGNQLPVAVSRNGVALSSAGSFSMAPIDQYMVMKVVVNDNNTAAKAYQVGRIDGWSMDLDLAEVVAYNTTLSAGDQASVEAYLTNKWLGSISNFAGVTVKAAGNSLIDMQAGISSATFGRLIVDPGATLTVNSVGGQGLVAHQTTLGGGSSTVVASGGANVTLSNVAESAPSNITFGGNGIVRLPTANSYTGLTTLIDTVSVVAGSGVALGSTASGTVVNAGTALSFEGAITVQEPLSIAGSGNSNYDAALSGRSGDKNLDATITLTGNAKIRSAQNAMRLRGGVNIGSYQLEMRADGRLEVDNVGITGSGSVLKTGGEWLEMGEGGAVSNFAGGLTVTGGHLDVRFDNAVGTGTITMSNNGSYLLTRSGADITNTVVTTQPTNFQVEDSTTIYSGNVTLGGAANLFANNSATSTIVFQNAIAGGQAVTKGGIGLVVLEQANAFSNVTLTAGTLRLKSDGGLGNTTTIDVPTGATLEFDGNLTFDAADTLDQIVLSGGTLSSSSGTTTVDIPLQLGLFRDARFGGAGHLIVPQSIGNGTGVFTTGFLNHYGFVRNPSDTLFNLSNNGGMLSNPTASPFFTGQGMFTTGPSGRGLDFDTDQEFTAAVGTPADNYNSVWVGYLNVPAGQLNGWEFREADRDDWSGIWVDIDGDGVLESTSAGLATNSGEQLAYNDQGTKTVNFTSPGPKLVAFTHLEGGGGSRIEFRFKSPSMPAQVVVKPSDPAQAGLWSPVNTLAINNNVIKTGTGTLTLQGDNTFNGAVIVNAGTVVAAHNNALGLDGGNVDLRPGASFGLQHDRLGNNVVIDGEQITGADGKAPGQLGTIVNLGGNNTLLGNVAASTGPVAGQTLTIASTGGTLTVGALGTHTIDLKTSRLAFDGAGNVVVNSNVAGQTAPLSTNAFVHYGYHVNNDGAVMDLNNNGGMLNGNPPKPTEFGNFFGQSFLTSGPQGQGLRYISDQDFINTGSIGQIDNYSSLFLAKLRVTAATAGVWHFRINQQDDPTGIWVDINGNGVFESSTPGLGSNRGEQLSWSDTTNRTVTLGEGDYLIAFTHREGGGGSVIDARFRSPLMGTEAIVNPSDPSQAGIFLTTFTPDNSLVKDGTGRVTLAGNNSYAGASVVNAGVLVVAGNSALGTSAAGTTVNAGGTLALQNVNGPVALNGESLVLNGLGAAGQPGALVNVSGNNTIGGASLAADVAVLGQFGIGSQAGTLTINSPIDMKLSKLVVEGDGDVVLNGQLVGYVPGTVATLDTLEDLGTGFFTFTAAGQSFTGRVEDDGTNTWLVIGRGREGWQFDTNGQGSIAAVSQNLGTAAAFAPAAYSDAIINGLLAQSGINATGLEMRIRRATDVAGTAWQESRWRDFTNSSWTLDFDQAPAGLPVTYQILSGPGSPATFATDTHDTSGPSGNDAQRIFTWPWGSHNNSQGFAYGGTVTTGQNNATSFLWEFADEQHAIPYTEISIRRRTPAADIVDNSLVKNGAGRLTIGAGNTLSDGVTVNAGEVIVAASSGSATGTGPVQVNGGTLGGTGTISGAVSVASGASLAPGLSPGVLALAGGATLVSGSSVDIEMDGTAGPGVTGGHDQLSIAGSVDLTGVTLNVTPMANTPPGSMYVVVDNDGADPIVGTFVGMPEGHTFAAGAQTFQLTYLGGDGNDVALIAAGTAQNPYLFGTMGPDTFVVTSSGGNLQVTRNGVQIYSESSATLMNVNIDGLGGDDVMLIDYALADVATNISFNGNTGNDSLAVLGDGNQKATYEADYTPPATPGKNLGRVLLTTLTDVMLSEITFSNVEPLDLANMATFTVVTNELNDSLQITDGKNLTSVIAPVNTQDAIVISSTAVGSSFETVAVWNSMVMPGSTLVIDTVTGGGDGNDTISLGTVTGDGAVVGTGSNGIANLTINTGTAGTDAVALAAAASVAFASGTVQITTAGGVSSPVGSSLNAAGVTISQAGTSTIAGLVDTGASGFTKLGAGTLVLSANNTSLDGTLRVAGGVLEAVVDTAVNPLGTSSVQIDGGQMRFNRTAALATGLTQKRVVPAPNQSTTTLINYDLAGTTTTVGNINGNATGASGMRWTGLLQVATAGNYSFRTRTDDGSRLYIDGVLVVNNDGPHGAEDGDSQSIALSAGLHSIRMDYAEGSTGGTGQYLLSYSGPDQPTMGAIPSSRFFLSTAIALPNSVTVTTAGGSIDLQGNLPGLTLGTLNIGAAGTTNFAVNSVSGRRLDFQNTNFQASAATVNFDVGQFVGLGRTVDGANSGIVLNKMGAGQLILDNNAAAGSENDLGGTTMRLSGGRLVNVASNVALSTIPIAGAAIEINGGTLTLDTKVGDYAFTNPITVTASGGIEVVPGVVTLTHNTGGVAINAGQTLTYTTYGGDSQVRGALLVQNSAVSGAGNIVKANLILNTQDGNTANTGFVQFNTANTYTGSTTITGGALIVSNTAGLGDTSGDTTVASGGQLRLQGGITLPAGETITINGDGPGGALRSESGNNNVTDTIVLSGNARITVSANTLTPLGGITDGPSTFGITKDGAGELLLTLANSYNGTTTLNGGTLSLGDNGAIGTGTLALQSGTLGNTGLTPRTLSNAVSFTGDSTIGVTTAGRTGDFIFTGNGTLTGERQVSVVNTATFSGNIGQDTAGRSLTKAGTGTLVLSGNNTYSGWTQVNAGILTAASNNALGTAIDGAFSNGTVVLPGATLALQGGINYATLEELHLNGTGGGGLGALQSLSGNNTFAGPIYLGSAATIGSSAAGSQLTLAGAITANYGLTFTGAGDTNITGVIGGATGYVAGLRGGHLRGSFDTATTNPGGLVQSSVVMGNTSTRPRWRDNETWVYTGEIYDADGIFSLAENIDDSVIVLINGVERLRNGNYNRATTTGSSVGLVTVTAGTDVENATVAGANAAPAGNITTNFGAGSGGWHTIEVRFGNGSGGAGSPGQTAAAPDTGWTTTFGFGYSAAGSTSANGLNYVQLAGGLGTVDGNLRTAVSNSLTKTGSGKLTLSGANTYSGPTTVNAGRLEVNGSTTAASSVTVNAGGTLGGTGTINGTVAVTGGAVEPGSSPGVLNTANVSFTAASAFNVELGGPAAGNGAGFHDQLNVTGTVNLGGATLAVSSFGGFVPLAGNSYIVIRNDGADAVSGAFAGLAEGATLDTSFLGSGLTARVSYQGGDGNDVAIVVDGGLTFSGTAAADSFELRRVISGGGDSMQLLLGGVIVDSRPTASVTGTYVINAGDGNDTLLVNYGGSGGYFGAPVVFNGQGQASAPGDTLVVGGNTATTITHTYSSASDGTIDIDGRLITYTGLEPVTDNMLADNRIFTFTGAAEAVTLSDVGTANDQQSRIVSTLGEATTFTNPTLSLTINLTNGTDTLSVQGLDTLEGGGAAFSANLTITHDGGDSVSFQTAPTNLGAGTLTVTAQTITFDQTVTTTGNASLTAAGAIATGGTGVDVAAASLTASAGTGINLDMNVNTLTATTAAGTIEIDETNAVTLTNVTSAGGNITVRTGNTAGSNLTIDNLNAGATGDVTLVVGNGNLVSGAADGGAADIVGRNLTITLSTAGRNVGVSAANRLEIDVTQLQLTTQTSLENNAFIVDTAGGLTVTNSTVGSIGQATFDLLVLGGDLRTTPAGDGNREIGARHVVLQTTGAGRIGTGTADRVEVNAIGSITAVTAGGAIFLASIGGDLLAGNINAGAGNVDLLATAGNIVSVTGDTNVADIVGNNVTLRLGTDVRKFGVDAANRLEIDANVLQLFVAVTGSGADAAYIVDTAGGLQMNDSSLGIGGTTFDLLVQGGNLTSAVIDNVGDVRAENVRLAVTGGGTIGTSAASPLEINTVTATFATTDGGDIFLLDVDGSFPINTVNAAGGDVSLRARMGSITDVGGAAVNVTAASLTATALTAGAGIDLDTDVDQLTFNAAGAVTIDNAGTLELAGASAAASLVLTATGGISDATAATTSVSGLTTLSATSITLGDSATDGVNFGSLTFSSAGAVVISEDSAMQLTGSSSAASAVLTSSGALTDSGSTLNVAGNLSVMGASITLGDGADVLNAGSLTFNSAGAVSLSEDSSTALAGTSTAGTLVLTSAADISDAAGTSVTVIGNATLTAAGVVLGDDVGDSTNFGTLTVVSSAGVAISEDSALDLAGASSGVGSVVLSSTDGSFALPAGASLSVSGAGSDITLNAADDVVIGGSIMAVDRLSINLDGGVADVGGSSLSIAATSVITTGGGVTGGTVITGGAEADLFSFRPQTTTAFVVDGGAPVLPVTPGDVLDLDLSGFAAGSTILTLGPTAGSGSYSFAAPQNEQSVSYTSIETVDADITGGYHLVLDLGFSGLENGAADTVDARLSTGGGANLELSVNSLPFFSGVAASIRSLTVIGSDDADTFTLTEVEGQLPSFVAAAPPVDNTAIGGGASLGAHQNATSTAVLGAQAVTIHFAGGAGSNTVGLVLTSTDDAAYFADTVGADQSGNLAVPADTLLSFAGVASLNLTGAGGSLTVDASSTPAVSAITLASPAAGQTSISGNVDLATSLAQGFAGLSVLGGDGAETIEVLAVGAGLTTLTLSGNNRAGTDAAADTLRVHTLPAGITTASLLGGAGSDTFQLYSSTSTVDGILSPVTVNGSDGNVGGNTDTLVVVDSGDADGDVVNITQNSLEGLTGYSGTPDVSYSNIDVLTVTATAGADTITTSLAAGSDLNVVTVNGNDSADQFYLSLPDPGAGPGSGIATVNLSGDAGNDSFGDATTKIQPSRTTAVNINGGAPTPGGLPTGNTVGDHLSLDLSAIPTTSAVIVTTVPGQVIASGYAGFSFADIEDLDLYDSTGLTTIEMGDLYARGTEQADSFVFTNGWLPEQPSLMRVMINSFGGYLTIPGKIVVYARGGNDYLTQHDTPRIAHFYGEGGNDYLAGALQADLLVGGLNDDQLLGSSGNDTIWGDEGPTPASPAPQDDVAGGFDRINGGLGNDIIYAGGGNDQAFGNGDDDYLHGGQGDDTLDGGEGNDRLYGSAGNDQLSGYFGYDLLSGGEGNDILTGNSGNDVLIGGLGSDSLVGNDDSDLMVTGTTVPVGAGATSANSTAAGDANDQALLALLLAWGTTGTDRTLLGTVTQDGVYDEVFSGNGNDEITRDNPLDRLFDFTAGQDEEF